MRVKVCCTERGITVQFETGELKEPGDKVLNFEAILKTTDWEGTVDALRKLGAEVREDEIVVV